MISLILLAVCIWIGVLIWQDRARERKFDEGLDKMRAFFDENPDFLLDEEDEDDWYYDSEFWSCDLCDDPLYENDAMVAFPAEDGGMLVFCEFCINPALKG